MKRDLQIHLFCKPRAPNRVEFLLLQVKLHPQRIGLKIRPPHVNLMLLCSYHTLLVNLLLTTRMKLSVTGNWQTYYLHVICILKSAPQRGMLPCKVIYETPGLRLAHRHEYGILFDNLMICLQHHFSEKISVPGKQVCRFFGTLRGCFSGDNCKFLHPGRDVSSHERYPVSQTSQDHFPPDDAPVNQESGLVSRGTYFLLCLSPWIPDMLYI